VYMRWLVVALLALLVACGGGKKESDVAQDAPPPAGYEKTAPLFEGMGTHTHRVTTRVGLAQTYFNQGLILSYGFNHAEAARSFREAQKLDPDCAMAYWGEALVLGPNINAAMEDENVPLAWAALQKALERKDKASERERAYIDALAARYVPEPVADRSELDVAYANAMREVAGDYPDDLDASTLFAEALMNTTPWDYWQDNGEPKWVTEEILATLERVLAADPNHPGANHFYIHTVEAQQPERGVAAADRLGSLVPGAGHLVHMPCHIYVRVGRYAEASDANEDAIAADDSYITQCHAQGLYPLAYMPHNRHFLWFTAAMEGRSERSIEAAKHVAMHVDKELMREPGYGTLQHFYTLPLWAMARFGKWDMILATPRPKSDLKYPNGVWYFARGMAHLRKGDPGAATASLVVLDSLAADPELDTVTIWDINTTRQLLQIASHVLAGEIAATHGNYRQAIAHLNTAVDLESQLRYDEPAPWYAPVRQTLGAILLQAGRAGDAETVYRAELEMYPNNGWSLYGLAQALSRRGKQREADEVMLQFEAAWARADVQLTSSRF